MTRRASRPPVRVDTFAQQVRLVRWLGRYFGVRCRVTQKATGRSYAFVRSRDIELSDATRLGRRAVCLHEFAHLVAEQRYPGEGHKHGRVFCEALWDVIHVAEHPPQQYPWGFEYATVARICQRWLVKAPRVLRPPPARRTHGETLDRTHQ